MKQIVFLLLLLNFTITKGQVGAGSSYSIFGLGELKPNVSAQSAGMGFTSIGMSSRYHVNTVNPAANAYVGGYFSHIVDIGFFVHNTQLKTQDATESNGNGGLSQLSYWFRFNNKWTGLVGLSNYSDVGYNLLDNDVLVSDNTNFSINYQGSGGLNQMYFSNSFEITKNLSLGAKFSFIFGNIFNNEIASSSQIGDAFNVENSIHISRLNVDFGLNYLIRGEKHDFNVGLIYDNGTDMTGSVESSITSSDGEVVFDESDFTRDYSLPQKIGLGLSFRSKKITLGADLEFNQWSKAKVEGESLRDTWRYSFGLEYIPNAQGDAFMQRVSFRTGIYTENSYLDIEDTSFSKWGVTAGLGVPLRNGSAINISYHRKHNGTLRNDLIYETTNEFTLTLSIRERWFVRGKYD